MEISIEDLDPREDYPKPKSVEQTEEIDISSEGRTTQIGTCLGHDRKGEMTWFLRENSDVFAWSTAKIPGIFPSVISHSLNINPLVRSVKQKKRKLGPKRLTAVRQETSKLLKADFIREVHYPKWLSNVVMVKKAREKWKMCVDFTDLNKACPKDSFSLSSIDRLVDASVGHHILSFIDAFSGYNQIMMNPSDQENTAFITKEGLYYYKVMPFGLKNDGATYQRLVNKIFADKIDRSIEVYVDDMLVKSPPIE